MPPLGGARFGVVTYRPLRIIRRPLADSADTSSAGLGEVPRRCGKTAAANARQARCVRAPLPAGCMDGISETDERNDVRREGPEALRLRLRRAVHGRTIVAGREGRGPGRDDGARRAGASGLHDHDRRLPRLHDGGRRAARRSRGRGRRPRPAAGRTLRQTLRRPERSPVAVSSLGRGDLDAGNDGHNPQSRTQRRVRARSRARDGQRALRA